MFKSACTKNYGAILFMAQVFNNAFMTVLTDLLVSARSIMAKIVLFEKLCVKLSIPVCGHVRRSPQMRVMSLIPIGAAMSVPVGISDKGILLPILISLFFPDSISSPTLILFGAII